MRFPSFADLDSDQRKIYNASQSSAAMLIVGPPGSGKTVVAMHRAFSLADTDSLVSVIMFNKVLSRYTSNYDDMPANVQVMHMHEWIKRWYRGVFGKSYPTLKSNRYIPDWMLISKQISNITSASILAKAGWGHLIIDEGQDFPKEMYKCLMTIMKIISKEKEISATLTVFADDNQSIGETNSTISELCGELNTNTRNRGLWRLNKNYRNSREVALFAKYYQVQGASSVELPDREIGRRPIVFLFSEFDNEYTQIVNQVKNLGDVEAGVVVFGKSGNVRYAHQKISEIVIQNHLDIRVQGYSSGNIAQPLADAKQLKFDTPPSITIVHSQSAKGLEFDIVFLLKLDDLQSYDAGELDAYKKLYVCSSRARKHLFVLLRHCSSSGMPKITRLLPKPEEELCQYMLGADAKELSLDDVLKNIDWKPSATGTQVKELKHDQFMDDLMALQPKKLSEILEAASMSSMKLKIISTVVYDYVSTGDRDSLASLVVELGVETVRNKYKLFETA